MNFEKAIFFAWILLLTVSVFSSEKIKVAIYKEDAEGLKTYGETGIYDALKETSDINPKYISEMSLAKLKAFDVLILTKKGWQDTKYKPSSWKENLREWVKDGHGVMAMHETAGCTIPAARRYYKWNLFPETGTLYRIFQGRELVISSRHPIIKNAAPNPNVLNQVMRHGYTDYAVFRKGKNGFGIVMGIIADKKSKELKTTHYAVVAGKLGKGRVVLNGMLSGYNYKTGAEAIPQGAERHILLDGVRWLANKLSRSKIKKTSYIGCPLGKINSKWVQSPDGLVLQETMSTEQLKKVNRAFLEPILKKVNPPVLAKNICSLSIGVLKSSQSAKWFEALKQVGAKRIKELSLKDIESGLAGISVLVIPNTNIARKYVPVIDEFISKGGKLLATESAGYDSPSGQFSLTEILCAGTYISTMGVEYFSLTMPDEIKRKEIDKRRSEWFVNRCKIAMNNGASGMAYFTVAKAFKQEYARFDVFKESDGLLNACRFDDYKKELRYVSAMSSLWKNTKTPILKSMPFTPQLGYLILRHITVRDINFEALAEECKNTGINIITTQVSYIDRFYASKKNHVTLLREHFLEKLVPELAKRGIQCWLNIIPHRNISEQYCIKHPEECMMDSKGRTVKRICPVRSRINDKYTFPLLERFFDKYPYLNGISLDEPNIRINHCFCPECRKLFNKMFPGEKMTFRSDKFRKFREYLWSEYYVKPYAEFLRKHRPRRGVLMLAAPGHNKPHWSMNSNKLANSEVQVFANENAQTRSQCMFNEVWAKYKLKYVSCNKLTFIKDHPLLKGIDVNRIAAKAVRSDIFYGADALAYVTDGECSYPGIIARNDTGSVYFAFDPLVQNKLVVNTLNWFIANDHHTVPQGMVLIPAGKFKMKLPRADMTAGRYPDEMVGKEINIKAFYLDKFEISNKEYEKFDPKHNRSEFSKGDDMPVTNVSMNDAKNYCNWRSIQEKLEPVYTQTKREDGFLKADLSKNGYRLATVAEWQKAAAGPKCLKYSWGNIWWRTNGRVGVDFNDGAVNTGSYYPNKYGLYDMTGNVWEWCEGYEKYPFLLGRICGGAWHNNATECRVSFYNFLKVNLRRGTIGFRCARNSPKQGLQK